MLSQAEETFVIEDLSEPEREQCIDTPFTVVVDQREKKPLLFSNSVRKVLRHGDYSLLNMESLVAVERKSLDDMAKSLTFSNRHNFEERIMRAKKELLYYSIICEFSFSDCDNPDNYRSRILPQCLKATLIKWQVKHKIPIIFCGNRLAAAQIVKQLLEGFMYYYIKNKKMVTN